MQPIHCLPTHLADVVAAFEIDELEAHQTMDAEEDLVQVVNLEVYLEARYALVVCEMAAGGIH